ncbi:MAG: DUF3014 domain-containing protein [Gammaproteobacteria bacterium]|nr:DUF3014 domain-containing protein [Gammaproteobacteria bacterium]MDH4256766.1 DUF3014 domain-containing protein [Gammaproteobacteria bacterium]MDH5311068.1 DUF3014 domain-containing protein [Gammaproteobacteria bacterium]
MNDENFRWLVPVLLVFAVALAAWYFLARVEPPLPAETPTPAAGGEPVETMGPRYPLPPEMPEREGRPELTPLPPLDESDSYFKLELADLFGAGISVLLVESGLIEKIVATVDNLPRSHVAERIRPLSGLPGPFAVDGQDGSGQFTLKPENYSRYGDLVGRLDNADVDALVSVYRRYYPLFQDAYVGLGYPEGYFNDRVVEVIDHLLDTPEVTAPIELVRPHVLYQYADPELEAQSSGRKLLLRMGPENASRVKDTLREIRERIVD